MSIELYCPQGHKLRVPDHLAGKKVRCPECSTRVVVPDMDRTAVDVSDSDVRPVDPASRRAPKKPPQPGPKPPELPRPSSKVPPSSRSVPKQKSQTPESGSKEARASSGRSSTKGLWLVLGGVGAGSILVLAGVFVGVKLIAPQNASQQAATQQTASQQTAARAVDENQSPRTEAADHAKRSTPSSTIAEASSESPKKPAPQTQQDEDQNNPPATAHAATENPAQPAATSSAPVSSSESARVVVQLPAAMQQLVVGGSGKYLVAALPSVKSVAVIDVASKKIAKLIALDDEDLLVAAGQTRFVVHQRGRGSLSRFSLETFERELTVSCEPYDALAMGSASEGPLLAAGVNTALIDLQSLKPTVLRVNIPFWSGSRNLVASTDGKVFGGWRNHGSPAGMAILEIEGERLRTAYYHSSSGAVIPSADGQVIYAESKRFDRYGKPIGESPRNRVQAMLLPAATGPFCMTWILPGLNAAVDASPAPLTIRCQNDENPLLTVKDFVLPEIPPLRARLRSRSRSSEQPTLPTHQRLFWLPAEDALVSVPASAQQLVIQHFNLKEELDKGGTDYFLVASTPPSLFQRGQKLSYTIVVLSKKGSVQYTLENSPSGMTVSSDGVVSWDVPADFSPHEASALVKIRDASGQELTHSIKLTDGQSSPPSDQPELAERATPGSPAFPNRRTTTVFSAPDSPARRIARHDTPVTSPPKSKGENRWQWTGGSPVFVRGEKGNFGGILLGDKLYLVKDSGAFSTQAVTVPSKYLEAGLRANAIIGVADNPTRVEVLDRHGKLLRKVLLPSSPPSGLTLHPTKPVCYVCLDQIVGPFRGTFAAVDEKAGTVKPEDENLGQDLIVDPAGRFLVSTYVHHLHVGVDQVIVTESPRGGRRRGVPSGRAQRRTQVVRRYANVALLLVYDLDSPLQPEFHTGAPLQTAPGQMRISYDGHRLTTLPPSSRLVKYAASNPMDLKAPLTNYDLAADNGHFAAGSDVAYHPLLPIAAIVGAGTIAFFDSESGSPLSGKKKVDLPDLATSLVRRAMFSGDGKHLVVLASEGANQYTLVRAPLPLTEKEQAAMHQRAASLIKTVKAGRVALSALTAWRGGLTKIATTAQIAANYSDSVVIVRSGNSTGTGFLVGSSGLILTAAHCVSPMESVQVVYHPQGKPDEKLTVDANVMHRDRKTDMALLKIDVKKPLHPVVLADPVDVKSGEEVTIIANPGLGDEVLDNTVTTGIISNVKRMIAGNPYIQSSAAVNPGSSGGPMFDHNGRVIGVVVLKAGIEGVGFAVPPAAIARFLLRATRRDGTHGRLERDWVDSGLKSEIHGSLVGVKSHTVTLVEKTNGQSTHPFSDFSPGDQGLLSLLAATE